MKASVEVRDNQREGVKRLFLPSRVTRDRRSWRTFNLLEAQKSETVFHNVRPKTAVSNIAVTSCETVQMNTRSWTVLDERTYYWTHFYGMKPGMCGVWRINSGTCYQTDITNPAWTPMRMMLRLHVAGPEAKTSGAIPDPNQSITPNAWK